MVRKKCETTLSHGLKGSPKIHSIMVWGFKERSGLRKIGRVGGIINSAKYTRILEENLVPYIVEGDIFQQYGAPCHASKSTTAYFEEKEIAILADLPSQSPDFNIIEHGKFQKK